MMRSVRWHLVNLLVRVADPLTMWLWRVGAPVRLCRLAGRLELRLVMLRR